MAARKALARNTRRIRLARGWSQERLAQECGLHRTYVSAVERSERNIGIDNVERIAKALRVSLAELLTGGDGSR